MMDTIIERKTDTFPDLLPALPEDNDTPIDILDREKVVTQLMELLITLSNSKSSCTFALNGKWGAGKTFVLNMWSVTARLPGWRKICGVSL